MLGVGIPTDKHTGPMRKVAPGWKLRVLLVQPLFANPDILLLDEPTNHLDMESIESLNNALEKYKGTLVFVSHDREFVSSLATRIIEIKLDGSITDYRGSYEEYLASQGVE
jgi:ATPase subunit of ABC transporter with duplicated ATPase domains